jgi:hypothetical protein
MKMETAMSGKPGVRDAFRSTERTQNGGMLWVDRVEDGRS